MPLAKSLFTRYCENMPAKVVVRGTKYYHIYNSGVEKRVIFTDDQDYETFISFLSEYLNPPASRESSKKDFTVNGKSFRGTPHLPKNYYGQIELLAYSLMPGHFHLVLTQEADRTLESFIRSLCTRYSMYFNRRHSRSGSLFEGPYKSAVINDKHQLVSLTDFIHHGANNFSSYPEYSGKRDTSWVNTSVIQTHKNNIDGKEKIELSKEITLENEDQNLERRDLVDKIKPPENSNISKSSGSRLPEISVLVGVFLILTFFGMRNIKISQAKNISTVSSSPSTVLSESTEAVSSPEPQETPQTSSGVTKTLVVVKVSNGSGITNIRLEPKPSSEKIGEAKEAQEFELMGVNSGWYKVRVSHDISGYIYSGDAYLQQTNN